METKEITHEDLYEQMLPIRLKNIADSHPPMKRFILDLMASYSYCKMKELNDKNNTKVALEETKTAKECWRRAGNNPDSYGLSVREAMDEYADSVNEYTYKLFNNPCVELKPLEDLWRDEHPSDKYTIPDRTEFYKWIRIKVLGV